MRYKRKIKNKIATPAHEFVEGLKYIWKNAPVRLLILIFAITMLFVGGLNVAFSIYIRDVVNMDIGGYGALEVLFGIGTVLGSVSTGILAGRLASGKMVMLSILGIGAMILTLGLLPMPIVALVNGGLLIGYFVGFLQAPATAIFQRAVEEEYRGRVFGAQGAIIQGAQLISIIVIGILISFIGIIPVILFSASVLIVLSISLLISRKASKVLSVGE